MSSQIQIAKPTLNSRLILKTSIESNIAKRRNLAVEL